MPRLGRSTISPSSRSCGATSTQPCGFSMKARRLAREVGRVDLIAKNEHALGVALVQAGDVRAALPLLERATASFREGDDRHQLVWADW